MITVSITATNYVVQSTSTDYNYNVTCDNTIFTVTNQVSSFTITNVTPTITFTTDGLNGFDFTVKNKGAWVSGYTYTRNDVVYYEYSTYICSIDPLDTLVSSVNPKDDPTNWELFIFNEWPRAYLTITNWLDVGSTATIGGTLSVSSNTSIGGQLDIYGDTYFHANDLIGIYELGVERLNVGERVVIGTNNEASTSTLTINGLQYPANKGTYGQVLYTNGTTNAAWVNLGELTFWQLSEDLKTEGFNIVSNGANNQLIIGGGQTGAFHNSINFNTVAAGGEIEFTGVSNFYSNVNFTQNVAVSGITTLFNKLRVDDATGIEGWNGTTATYIKINTGLQFPDGSIQTEANAIPLASSTVRGGIKIPPVGGGVYMNGEFLTVSPATTSTFGGIYVGEFLGVDGTGVLYVNTATLGPALGSLAYTLPVATDSTLGGIKVGPTLDINTTTGVLNADYATTSSVGVVQVGDFLSVTSGTAIISVNTATLIPYIAQYGLPIATTSTLGGIIVGDYLTINTASGLLSINTATLGPALVDIAIPIASETVLGGVRVADSSTIDINTSTGDISVPIATASTLGVVQVGSGLSINGSGTLSLNSANSYGNISLTQDMETNGYNIRHSSGYSDVKLLLGTIQALLQGGASGVNITVTTSTVEINTLNTTTNSIQLKSPIVVAGYDIYNSKVQASSYYDFAGTGAAFFPANVKFSDDTIQRTAWRGYDQGLI